MIRKWNKIACAALLLAANGMPLTVSAQDKPDAATMAKKDIEAGVRHFKANEFHESYVRFKSAAAVYPSPHVRSNMVLAGSKSSYPQERVESARAGRALLREGKMHADDLEKVQSALDTLKPVLGRIELRGVKSETVRADGELLDASVLVDPLDVSPGKHEILVDSERHEITVDEGETRTVTVGVAESPASSTTMSKPPVTGPVVAPPHHTTKVPRDGRPIVVGVLGGLAVASLGTALASTLVALGSQSDMRDATRSPTDRADSRSTYDSVRTVSTITTWTGVGLGVAAGAVWFLWPTKTVKRSAAGWSVAPVLSPTGVGVSGQF